MADEPKDLDAIATALAARHGDEKRALVVLLDENHSYRAKLRDIKAELATAQQAAKDAAVPDGAVVLKGAEAKAWEVYTTFGTPAEVQAALDAGKAAAGELTKAKRDQSLAAVAAEMGVKTSVLKALTGHAEHGFAPELRDEPDPADASKTVKVPYAVRTDADGSVKAVKLTEYVTASFGEDVAATLTASAGSPAPAPASGPRFPATGPATGGSRQVDDAAERAALAGSGAYNLF